MENKIGGNELSQLLGIVVPKSPVKTCSSENTLKKVDSSFSYADIPNTMKKLLEKERHTQR